MTNVEDSLSTSPLLRLSARHMRVAWTGLPLFIVLGVLLETLHAFKLGFYLDVGNETRRLMWTLAHAHGIGLSLLNAVYAITLRSTLTQSSRALELASMLAVWATVLIPLGFFLGGVVIYGGDPGIGVLTVPAGAALLLASVLIVAREVFRATR